ETAAHTGARIVHACGFDSIHYDMGALYTVRQLSGNEPVSITATLRLHGTRSGSTIASALTAFSRPREMRRVAQQRRRIEQRPAGRDIHAPLGTPHRDSASGDWLAPMPTLDPQLVTRSAAALDEYGTHFTHRQYVAYQRLPTHPRGHAGLRAAARLSP